MDDERHDRARACSGMLQHSGRLLLVVVVAMVVGGGGDGPPAAQRGWCGALNLDDGKAPHHCTMSQMTSTSPARFPSRAPCCLCAEGGDAEGGEKRLLQAACA